MPWRQGKGTGQARGGQLWPGVAVVNFRVRCPAEAPLSPYLLGLLAMIKCSICSYQCDNWYVSNWELACHIYFSVGRGSLELAQTLLRVALVWHIARSSTPKYLRVNDAHGPWCLGAANSYACVCVGYRCLAGRRGRGKGSRSLTSGLGTPLGPNLGITVFTS